MPALKQSGSSMNLFSLVLYALAVVILVLGGYLGISFANARAAFMPLAIAFQTPGMKLLLDVIAGALRSLGLLLFLIALVISVLLAACGALLARSMTLSQRLTRVETALQRANLLAAES